MNQGKGTILGCKITIRLQRTVKSKESIKLSTIPVIGLSPFLNYFFFSIFYGSIQRTFIASKIKLILSTGENMYRNENVMDFIYPV